MRAQIASTWLITSFFVRNSAMFRCAGADYFVVFFTSGLLLFGFLSLTCFFCGRRKLVEEFEGCGNICKT